MLNIYNTHENTDDVIIVQSYLIILNKKLI